MPTQDLNKALSTREETVNSVFPFAATFKTPIQPAKLKIQNSQTDRLGRLTHIEAVDAANQSAIVTDFDFGKHLATISTGADPQTAKTAFTIEVSSTAQGGRVLTMSYPANPALNLSCTIATVPGSQAFQVDFVSGATKFSGSVEPGSKVLPPVLSQIKEFAAARPPQGPGHDDSSLLAALAPQIQKSFGAAIAGGGAPPVANPMFWKCFAVGVVAGLICGVFCAVAGHVLCEEGEAR